MIMEKKKRGRICGAINCTNARFKCPVKSLFRFPKEEERCKLWVQNTRRQDLMGKSPDYLYKNIVLCEDHFEVSQFRNVGSQKKQLIRNAVPTVFQVPDPPAKVTTQRWPLKILLTEPGPSQDSKRKKKIPASQTGEKEQSSPTVTESGSQTSFSLQSPKEMQLKRKLKTLRNKLARLKKKVTKLKSKPPKKTMRQHREKLIEELSHYLAGPALAFVATQLRMSSKKERGARWSEQDKATALSLFHTSRKAYSLLGKIFLLPSVATLRRTGKVHEADPPHEQSESEEATCRTKEETLSMCVDVSPLREAMPSERDDCATIH